MKEDEGLQGIRFRCRFPDGVSPVMHVERSSVKDEKALERLSEGLKKRLEERGQALRVELVDELSGYFDRVKG